MTWISVGTGVWVVLDVLIFDFKYDVRSLLRCVLRWGTQRLHNPIREEAHSQSWSWCSPPGRARFYYCCADCWGPVWEGSLRRRSRSWSRWSHVFSLAPREHLEKGLRLSSAPPAEALRAAPSFVAARGAVPKGVVNVGKSRVLPWPIDAFDLEVCPEKIGVYGMNLKINIRVQN